MADFSTFELLYLRDLETEFRFITSLRSRRYLGGRRGWGKLGGGCRNAKARERERRKMGGARKK